MLSSLLLIHLNYVLRVGLSRHFYFVINVLIVKLIAYIDIVLKSAPIAETGSMNTDCL